MLTSYNLLISYSNLARRKVNHECQVQEETQGKDCTDEPTRSDS
jgi:hypothetical protein